MIIPGIESDVFKWNDEREKLAATGAFLLLNNPDLIRLCADKWTFYQQLIIENKEVAIPTVIDGDFSTFPVPFLLKPRRGYIMQPVIGNEDEEYTVSAFFDKDAQLVDHFALRRKLSGDGFTLEAQVVDFDFEDILLSLARSFKPVGPTNFQFRLDGGKVKLLEINPRISSATSLRSGFGYNESIISVNYFLGNSYPEKLDKKSIINKRAIRYMEDHIFS
jgi:carbamoyl-phosphate synthase large subunit